VAIVSKWVQVSSIGVSDRELRFTRTDTGAVIGVFQFPTQRSASPGSAFAGQPVIIQRIEPHAAASSIVPVTRWADDPGIDPCDWDAVCEATRRRRTSRT
jgi:hypothetical protein